jgi:hypothetical protein
MVVWVIWPALLLSRSATGQLLHNSREEQDVESNVSTSNNRTFLAVTPLASSLFSSTLHPSECWASWNSFSSLTDSQRFANCITETTESWTITFASRAELASASTYTVPCETGITRVRLLGPPTKIEASYVTVVRTEIWPQKDRCPYQGDAQSPKCEKDSAYLESTCHDMWARFTSMAKTQNYFDLYASTMSGLSDMDDCGMATHNYCDVDPGEDVVLIYWPPEVVSRDICANGGAGTASTIRSAFIKPNQIAVVSAITFKGPDMKLIKSNHRSDLTWPEPFVLSGPFTFTSPTVYVAHRTISISTYYSEETLNSVGSLSLTSSEFRPPGILTLNPEDVFSLRLRHGMPVPSNYPYLVAKGEFSYGFRGGSPEYDNSGNLEFLPFNYGNLIEPVPASVYYDARAHDCWGNQSHCATITDGSYRPQLAFKKEVWEKLVPGFWNGSCGVPRVVDPPIALHPLGELPTPTVQPIVLPPAGNAQDARPGDFVQGSWPQATPTGKASAAEGGQPGSGRQINVISDHSTVGESGIGGHDVQYQSAPSQGSSEQSSQMKTGTIGTDTISVLFSSGSLIAAYFGTATIHDNEVITLAGKVVSATKGAIYVNGKEAVLNPADGIGSPQNGETGGGNGSNASKGSEPKQDNIPSSQGSRDPAQYETDGKGQAPTLSSNSADVTNGDPSQTARIPSSTGSRKKSEAPLPTISLLVSITLLGLSLVLLITL